MKEFRMARFTLIFSLAMIVLGVSFTMGKDASQKSPGPGSYFDGGGRLRIISSSHQDIAWMDSPQKCIVFRDENCITPALEMMAKNPDYCFVMENMLNLMEYVERHPDRKADILRYTKEGRMEWGATFNQPYESLLSGEQLVRQTYFGRRWIRKNLPGCDAVVYFNPDVPGRALQMQQILSKSGIPYMVISRYHEGFYRWASPDGSSVVAFTPGHYSNSSALLNAKPAEGVPAIAAKLAERSPYYQKRNILPEFPLLNSVDFSKPTDFGPLIFLWNGQSKSSALGPGPQMQYSSAAAFFKALDRKNPSFDPVMGERPNLWLYIDGPTHHWAISAHREAGYLLPAAEMFSTVRALLEGSFKIYPAKTMDDAWQAAIYPDHGWGGKEGQVTDRLFRKKYEFARDKGREMLTAALRAISSGIKTETAKGKPVIIYNSLSWARTDPVTVAIKRPLAPFAVQDAQGKVRPHQVLPPLPDQLEGDIRLEFIAENVPPLGYKTFYLNQAADLSNLVRPQVVPSYPRPYSDRLENAFYRIDLAPGGVKSIFDKELKVELLNTGKFLGFEVFTMQSVGSGAGEFGRVQQPTMEGFDRLSAHKTPWVFEAGDSGPVKTVYSLTQAMSDCTIKEKLIVYNSLKRIDCEISMIGWDGSPYREYRMALPAAAPRGKIAYEVPMGVVEVGVSEVPGTGGRAYGNVVYDEPISEIRPREVQNFLNVSDPRFGLTLTTSVAVNDYQDPTDRPVDYPVLQAVLLASRRSCHGEGNWYLQEGDHYYRFSIVSHAPGWRNGYRPGIQANVPLFVVLEPAPAAGAALPEAKSFFSFSAGNVLFSTVKKAEDDETVILRCYDIEGRDADVQLDVFAPIEKAEKVNMIEEEGTPVPSQRNGLKLKIGHHAIETLKLSPLRVKRD
jgi:alpha-mannosidase